MPDNILPPARREISDVAFKPMLVALLLVVAGVGATALFARWLYPEAVQDDQHRVAVPRFADPVLQPDTAADMRAFRAAEIAHLEGTGWVDRERGSVHIPIGDAMRALARRGIPDWPSRPVRRDP